MQSLLNESNSIFDILTQAADGAEKVAKTISSKKDEHYLGGSISKYTKNLIMSFPIICDNTLSIDTAQMISKANEKNIVTMLQMMFASMSLKGSNGVEILKMLHMNMDADIEDIIDALDRYVSESSEFASVSDAECRDAIREMVYQLKTPQKSFPTESLNERSINDYQVRNLGGKMRVLETKIVKEADDPYAADRNRREEDRNRREEDRAGREKDKEKREQDKEKRDIASGQERDRNDRNQQFTRQILDTDFKKANELQPTLLVVNFNDVDDQGNVLEKKSFICGVKSRMLGADGMDIVERVVAKNRSALSFKNLIRATTGEVSFFKDFLLAMKQQKLNAKNAAKKGAAAQMWNLLAKRAIGNNINKLRRKGNDASAITTLVVNYETVQFMISKYKFDLTVPKNAKTIMDEYNLLGIVIADDANESAKFIYDGNGQFEELSYNALSKDIRDSKQYKQTVNYMNQMGR